MMNAYNPNTCLSQYENTTNNSVVDDSQHKKLLKFYILSNSTGCVYTERILVGTIKKIVYF
jgi:hypothetical protein